MCVLSLSFLVVVVVLFSTASSLSPSFRVSSLLADHTLALYIVVEDQVVVVAVFLFVRVHWCSTLLHSKEIESAFVLFFSC